jgi:hypothetical protein
MAARRFVRVLRVSAPAQNARMADRPEKVATIECAICGAFIEVYRRSASDQECVDWRIRDAELCRDPPRPLHRCRHARLEVRRRFPDETVS